MTKLTDREICENADDLLNSELLWEIWGNIFSRIEKINAEYYNKIMEKILDWQAITIKEHKNFVAILEDDEFLELAERYYNKVDIENIYNKLDMIDVLRLVKDQTNKSLLTNLELDWEIGFIFSMRRKTENGLKATQFVVWEDENWQKMIYEILHIKWKPDEDKVLWCGVRDETWEIAKRWYLDMSWNNLYGGVKYFWVWGKFEEVEGVKCLRVRENKGDDIKMVCENGLEL